MNTQPPFEDAPNAAGTGTEQVTDVQPVLETPGGEMTGDPVPWQPMEPVLPEPVADAVAVAEEEADLDDLLPGANPVPVSDGAVFVGETDYVPADPVAAGAALSAAVDAAEAVAEGAVDWGNEAPAAAPVAEEVAPVADAVAVAEEEADLDDLLPGANPVPVSDGAVFVGETDYVPADPVAAGAALSAAVDAAEAVAESAVDWGNEAPAAAPLAAVAEEVAPVADAVASAEEEADLDDLLPGANPVPVSDGAVFVGETDYVPADPVAAGAALSAAVDAAEAVAESAVDWGNEAPAAAPLAAVAEEVAPVADAVASAEEEADLDDLLPGANPVPVSDGAVFVGETDYVPADPVAAGAALSAAVDAAEAVAESAVDGAEPDAGLTLLADAVEAVVVAEAEEIVASAGDTWTGAPEPVAAELPDTAAPADAVAVAEEEADLDDLLPGAHPVPAEIEAAGGLDTDYMPADLPAGTGAALVAAVDAAEAVAEAEAEAADAAVDAVAGEDADSLDDFLPEVDPLMVAMVAEDAAEHATTEAEAVAVLDAVSGAVGGIIAEAEHTRERLGAATPGELWLKMWARSVDFWIAGARRKD